MVNEGKMLRGAALAHHYLLLDTRRGTLCKRLAVHVLCVHAWLETRVAWDPLQPDVVGRRASHPADRVSAPVPALQTFLTLEEYGRLGVL